MSSPPRVQAIHAGEPGGKGREGHVTVRRAVKEWKTLCRLDREVGVARS